MKHINTAATLLIAAAMILSGRVAFSYDLCLGDLHTHTSFSDGVKLPEDAYDTARYKADLCYLVISDHVEQIGIRDDLPPGSQQQSEWVYTKKIADEKNIDGKFVAIAAAEWARDVLQGHINIINIDDVEWLNKTNSVKSLYRQLKSHPGIMIGINHPYDSAKSGLKNFSNMKLAPEAIQQMAFIATVETEDLPWYYKALDIGWRVGPSGQQDTHNDKWGLSDKGQFTVLYVEKRSRKGIMEALAARRFYATTDRDLIINFTGNGQPMGTTINANSVDLSLDISHAKNKTIKSVALITNGGTTLQEWTPQGAGPYQFTRTAQASSAATPDWFVLLVLTSDNRFAVSAPVWLIKK